MDLDSQHLAPATFLRHHHLNPSGILGCLDHIISQPHMLHCTLLRNKPMSFKNCNSMVWSQKMYVRKILFGAPSSCSIEHPYDDLVTSGIPCRRLSYSATTWEMCCTILFSKRGAPYLEHFHHWASSGCKTVKGSVLHSGYYIKNAKKKANRMRVCCWFIWKPKETERKWMTNFKF